MNCCKDIIKRYFLNEDDVKKFFEDNKGCLQKILRNVSKKSKSSLFCSNGSYSFSIVNDRNYKRYNKINFIICYDNLTEEIYVLDIFKNIDIKYKYYKVICLCNPTETSVDIYIKYVDKDYQDNFIDNDYYRQGLENKLRNIFNIEDEEYYLKRSDNIICIRWNFKTQKIYVEDSEIYHDLIYVTSKFIKNEKIYYFVYMKDGNIIIKNNNKEILRYDFSDFQYIYTDYFISYEENDTSVITFSSQRTPGYYRYVVYFNISRFFKAPCYWSDKNNYLFFSHKKLQEKIRLILAIKERIERDDKNILIKLPFSSYLLIIECYAINYLKSKE